MPQPRIDVHLHYLPEFYLDALGAAGQLKPDGMAALPRWSEVEMLDAMDRLGIERAYLSISSPGVHFGDDAAAVVLARRVNEEGARLKVAHPGRVEFFASTPLPDVQAALAEVRHAYDQLGAAGVVFETNFHGEYLGDERLLPLYAELDRRGAVLFLHPTTPGRPCGCGALAATPLGFPAPMLDFIFDTTRTVTDMVLAGVLDRHPDLRVVVPHAGAALPILAARIDMFGPTLASNGRKELPSMREALRRFHYDLAGAPVPEMLTALLNVADPGRIHYGSDWPFTPTTVCERLSAALDDTPLLGDLLRAEVLRGNAERLFGRGV